MINNLSYYRIDSTIGQSMFQPDQSNLTTKPIDSHAIDSYRCDALVILVRSYTCWYEYFYMIMAIKTCVPVSVWGGALLTCTHSGPTRILLHAFWEPPSFVDPPSYSPDIQQALLPNLTASDSWDVYADGWISAGWSSVPHGGLQSHFCALHLTPIEGCHCLAGRCSRAHAGPWGGGRMMELVGVTSGIIILHALGKGGCVYTDNQGIVKQFVSWAAVHLPSTPGISYKKVRYPFAGIGATLNVARKTVLSGPARTGVSTWPTAGLPLGLTLPFFLPIYPHSSNYPYG